VCHLQRQAASPVQEIADNAARGYEAAVKAGLPPKAAQQAASAAAQAVRTG